tara:strand:+ start:692 stop:1231 length:540 start_codon:yes stop_codon:yes gene_type:complete
MSEPILENAEPKIEKRKRKPLSEEDKKRQLENLRLGRERAHQKRRELEAMGREMAKKETLKKEEEIASPSSQNTKVENVSQNTKQKEKKKKIVYVEEDSSSSEEEVVVVKKKKPIKQVVIKEPAQAPPPAPRPPPPPPPRPKVDIEAERQKKIALLQQQQIKQRKLAENQKYMMSIFGN